MVLWLPPNLPPTVVGTPGLFRRLHHDRRDVVHDRAGLQGSQTGLVRIKYADFFVVRRALRSLQPCLRGWRWRCRGVETLPAPAVDRRTRTIGGGGLCDCTIQLWATLGQDRCLSLAVMHRCSKIGPWWLVLAVVIRVETKLRKIKDLRQCSLGWPRFEFRTLESS